MSGRRFRNVSTGPIWIEGVEIQPGAECVPDRELAQCLYFLETGVLAEVEPNVPASEPARGPEPTKPEPEIEAEEEA